MRMWKWKRLAIVLAAVSTVVYIVEFRNSNSATHAPDFNVVKPVADFYGAKRASDFYGVPEMTLTVRLTSTPGPNRPPSSPNILNYFYCTLLRSATLYWSSQLGNVGIILDEDNPKDHEFAAGLVKHQTKIGINFSIYYEPLPPNLQVLTASRGDTKGYNRQLYSSFLMDNLIKTPVVAWIDADAKFITPVTRDNIMKGYKLRVKGKDTFVNDWVRRWDKTTKRMVGKPMPSDFMTYFPVYIWRDTITNCRNHIIKYMNVSTIEEAYMKAVAQDYSSPVNIIMTYAYYFEKDRYDWHIDIGSLDLQIYNKVHLTTGYELQPTDITRDLHVALHDKYYLDTTNKINRHAYCTAINETVINMDAAIRRMCQPFKGIVMWSLFEFTTHKPLIEHLTTWCRNQNIECVSLINEHFKNTAKLINNGVYDLDLNKVKSVEIAAKEMNIQCKAFH
ncbi:hypothetical protein SNE40_009971 [Patella caerulea]|uniref:Uncharacterized protein n=2 Tax=Patella caerulea TaxID=87958 RepID=A0AAN8JUD1_PATCE